MALRVEGVRRVTVQVFSGPKTELSAVRVPSRVLVNRWYSCSVTLRNAGDWPAKLGIQIVNERGPGAVEVSVAGRTHRLDVGKMVEVSTRDIVPPGESRDIRFSLRFLAVGTYTLAIRYGHYSPPTAPPPRGWIRPLAVW